MRRARAALAGLAAVALLTVALLTAALFTAALFTGGLGPSNASAHSLAFGVLVVVEGGDGASAVLRASGVEGAIPDLRLRASAGCALVDERRATDGALLVVRASLRCPAGLDGARLTVEGLTTTPITVAASVRRGGVDEGPYFLDAANPSLVVQPAPGAAQTFNAYLRLGLEHIAGGLDHLAFVLALLLLAFDPRCAIARRANPSRARALGVATLVTGFTLGHALTLSAAAWADARLPSPPVEALIALSILFVAAELLRDGPATLTLRRPGLVAVGFGLVHGLGFAGALAERGLPAAHQALAIAGFNLGVELGQLIFVLAVVAVGALALRGRAPSQRTRRALAWGVGVAAAVWTASRVDALWV